MSNSHNNTPARAYAFKFLYKLLLKDFKTLREELKKDQEGLDDSLKEFEHSYQEKDIEHPNNQLNNELRFFAKSIISGVLKDEMALRDKISAKLLKRSIDSLEKVDYALLLIGAYELLNSKLVPRNVILDEYINLAKEFGTGDSSKFINALLDKIN